MAATARSRVIWLALLGAPLAATTYFLVVYLAAEAACADGGGLFDADVLGPLIVVATLLAIAATAVVAGVGKRAAVSDDAERRFAGRTGLALTGLFFAFVVLVGGPVIGSTLCG